MNERKIYNWTTETNSVEGEDRHMLYLKGKDFGGYFLMLQIFRDPKKSIDSTLNIGGTEGYDSFQVGEISFLEGKFKESSVSCRKTSSQKEFIEQLEDYFSPGKSKPTYIWEHIKDTIINSNLSQEQRNAVGDIFN